MAIIESPTQPGVQMEVGRGFRAARVEIRPLEYRGISGEIVGGHYRTTLVTGLITILNAGDAIVSMRWSAANKLFVLNRLRLYAVITTAFGAAQEVSFDLVKVGNFTIADTGGTSATATINAGVGRKHNIMQPSQIADLRVATTVALGAGAGSVAEGLAHSFCALNIGNAVGSAAAETLFDANEESSEHPFVLATNEGFRVRVGFTQGATGVMRVSQIMDWAEIAQSAYPV